MRQVVPGHACNWRTETTVHSVTVLLPKYVTLAEP